MDRVFLPAACIAKGKAVVTGIERRHLADVLRIRRGQRFLATDGEGRELLLETESVDRRRLVARAVEETTRPPGPGRVLTLAVAPPKGGRMEIAVEKAVECGVGRIVPLRAARSVVKGRGESSRLERWRKVACSACAQAGRVHRTEITPIRPLREAFEEAAGGTLLLAHPARSAPSVAAALAGWREGAVTLFIGPEGGFTDAERDEGRRFGATEVSLGPNRLRTETAAIVAVTLALEVLSEGRIPRG